MKKLFIMSIAIITMLSSTQTMACKCKCKNCGNQAHASQPKKA